MTEPIRFVKDRKPVRHFAAKAMFTYGVYFPVCGIPLGEAKIGPRLTKRWRDVTCKRCLHSRWAGSESTR